MGSVFPIGVEAGPGIRQASNDCGSLAASLQPVDSCFCLDTGQGGQQTSGGLLVSCAPDSVEAVLEVFRQHGHTDATVIGAMEAGPAGVSVD